MSFNNSRQIQLKSLILKGEGERVDFKQKISEPYKIAKTLVAFANTHGGVLLVGVRDDKTITGVDPEEEKFVLDNAAAFYCDPPVLLIYKEIEFPEENKTVLIVQISESTHKPHFVRNKNNTLLPYIRQNDRSIPAGKTMTDLMKKGKLPEISPEIPKEKKRTASFNELKLIDHLRKNERVTLKQYMRLVNISRRRASRILTELTLSGILRVHEHDKEDYYTL